MAVDKITAAQFAQRLVKAILARNNAYDVNIGPIPDLIVNPLSGVLEGQNDRIRQIDSLLKLLNNGTYTYDDLVAFVANEGIHPSAGASAYATLTFSTVRVANDLTIQAGFPVATAVDEVSGNSAIFVTTRAATLPYADRAAYFNSDTQRYELRVPARCTAIGTIGKVAAYRIRRPLRPLVGFDQVYNIEESTGGRDASSTAELIEQYLISITGTNESTHDGTRKLVSKLFTNVHDSAVVYGDDPLLKRASSDAGAVDLWILGSQITNRTDIITYIDRLQPVVLLQQPVVEAIQVSQGSTVYIPGTDYDLMYDTTSGYSGSIKGFDAIVFRLNGNAPVPGTDLTIQYTQNSLVGDVQTTMDSPEFLSHGRSLLIRAAEQVDVAIAANVIVANGYDPATVRDLVAKAISKFINSTLLNGRIVGASSGGSLQLSDINAEVRRIVGVDNIRFTKFDVVGGTGIDDIELGKNRYARIADADIAITIV